MEKIEDLLEIIQTLRGENGCPWDGKQTPESMLRYLVEETYELRDSILEDDAGHICEELGDVLFQLLFISEIYAGQGRFTLSDCISKICAKMIRRHPHVYNGETLENRDQLIKRWDAIKLEEKKEAGEESRKSVLDRVPSGMPAMQKCGKVSKCVVKEGFDWDTLDEVVGKVREELKEFEQAVENGNREKISDEFGDILFTLVNVARFAGIDPELSLAGSTEKFEKRYRHMEKELQSRKTVLKDLPAGEVEKLWEQAKKACNKETAD